MYTLYCHINKLNGKSYIGYTKYSMFKRWRDHVRTVKFNNTAFSNALKKYGTSDVVWEHKILAWCETYTAAKEAEICFIKMLKTISPNGYNLTAGGEGVKGFKFSSEQKQRFLKIVQSKEFRQKNSEGQIRYWQNNENRIWRSMISKEIMSRAGMKEKIRFKTLQSMQKSEVRTKLILANSSIEHRRKKSESAKLAWQSSDTREKHRLAHQKSLNIIRHAVVKLSTEGKVIRRYASVTEASKFENIPKSTFLKKLKTGEFLLQNFSFMYERNYNYTSIN